MAERPPPSFYGVVTYQDPQGRFTFRYPNTWYQFEVDNRDGVLFSPETTDPQTWFSVWTQKLDVSVTAEDIDDLRPGVDEGLAQLAGVQVLSASEEVLNNLIKFERIFTFEEGDVTRKRRQWILYVATWMIVATYQGATEEEFDYWLPMGNYSFFHFNIPEALWFATDRDLSGQART